MNIIEIWQPMQESIGQEFTLPEYYDNEEEAQKKCKGFAKPKRHLGLAIQVGDGKPAKVYLFASPEPIEIFHTTEEMIKERALAKLTLEERKLLGV